jgi:hypothetical protein
VADDQAHACAFGGGDHPPACRQADRHRLFHQHVLALRRRHFDVRGVLLVRRCDVDQLDIGIGAERLDRAVSAAAEVRGEALGCLGTGIGGGDQLDARIGDERRQHHGKCPPESGDARLQPALTHGACLDDPLSSAASSGRAAVKTRKASARGAVSGSTSSVEICMINLEG